MIQGGADWCLDAGFVQFVGLTQRSLGFSPGSDVGDAGAKQT